MSELGVGLIGTGWMGKCHALAWRSVQAVFGHEIVPRLEVLCDERPGEASLRAPEFGFARHATNWSDVIADPRVDVVSITTPNGLHHEMAVAALEAGKHVWCEKPMALTVADAEAMAAAAGAAPGKTLLGYTYVQNPAIRQARSMIEAGVIGDLVHFRGQVDEDYLASPEAPWSWRSRIATGGLGVLGDLTCHLVSFAHTLVGEIASLSADVETIHRMRPVPGGEMREVENEDVAHAIVRFRSGLTGVLASSRTAWGRKNAIRVEVHGTKGTIAFDQERLNELQLFVADGPEASRGFRTILGGPAQPPHGRFVPAAGHQLGFNDLKVIECAHLLDCIGNGSETWISFADGVKIERVIHGMAASARDRQWVDL